MADTVLEFATDDPAAARALSELYHAAPKTTDPAARHYRLLRRVGGWTALAPGRAPYGAVLGDAWAFLEWRATEDLLAEPGAGRYLHAGGFRIGGRSVLLIGPSGAGKSTLAAHLAARGHRAWGDDLVRFAPPGRVFSASERSWKLDGKSLSDIELLKRKCADGVPGTLLASPNWYVSPAVFRDDWRAEPGRADVVVLLDAVAHTRPKAELVQSSTGAAAIQVAESLIGTGQGAAENGRDVLMTSVLEALGEATAWEVRGGTPAALADALERELGA